MMPTDLPTSKGSVGIEALALIQNHAPVDFDRATKPPVNFYEGSLRFKKESQKGI
jgi:hypothetical protein